MSDILVDIFPLEVVDNILLFLSEKTLKRLIHGLNENTELRALAISRLYNQFTVYRVEELAEAASLDARVGTMCLHGDEECIKFLRDHPSFVSNILNVKLHVLFFNDYKEYDDIPFRNVEVYMYRCFDPSEIPPNLKLIEVFESDPGMLVKWPVSLTSIILYDQANLKLIELPRNLRELHCQSLGELWDLLPPKLEKLVLVLMNLLSHKFIFPESLKELYIEECYVPHLEEVMTRLPLSLKKLELVLIGLAFSSKSFFPESLNELLVRHCSFIDIVQLVASLPASLRSLKLEVDVGQKLPSLVFPDSIEALDLSGCGLDSLEGFKYPKSLSIFRIKNNKIKELHHSKFLESLTVLNLEMNQISTLSCRFPVLKELFLSRNILTSMDGTTFPELEVLDISAFPSGGIRSIKNVQWPSTLKILKANGHCISDYGQTRLPKGLEELEINITGKLPRLNFPPRLENLKLTLRAHRKYDVSQIGLPTTLQKLEIRNVRSRGLNWKLPHLEKLKLTNFKGRLQVPKSVRKLNLHVEKGEHLKKIWLPQKLDRCSIHCSSGEFNDAISKLLLDYDSM